MTLDVRPLRPDEMERYAWLDAVGFGQQPTREQLDRTLAGPLRPEETLAVFDDGELASQMGVFPFHLRWHGATIAAGGVTAVATLPSHRRRGYLRLLMTRALGEMRERGQSLAILSASMAAIYQRYGYGLGFRQQQYRFDPRLLSFVDDLPLPGRVRLIPREQAASCLGDAYARFAAPRSLMLERPPDWWQWAFQWPPDVVHLIAAYEEAGEVLGFASYFMREGPRDRPGPRQTVNMAQFAWTTPAAHRALIRFLAGYDLASEVIIQRVPIDDPLPYQVQEPRLYGNVLSDGLWLRIVDLERAFSQRGYGAEGSLRIELVDELCPWNSGVWEIEAGGGAAAVQRTTRTPELRLSARVLAMLGSGCASASTLASAGLIQGAEPGALARADRLFAVVQAPFCLDHF